MRKFRPQRALCEMCAASHSQSRLFWIEHETLDLLWDVFGREIAIDFLERHRNRVLCERCIGSEAVQFATKTPHASEIVKQRVLQVLNGSRSAERRARLRSAMPKWADREAIRQVYQKAHSLTASTGIQHHVDHIIPLNSPKVCGLHIAENLQILPATDNLKKSNKLPDDVKSIRAAKRDTAPLEESVWNDLYPPRKTDLAPRLIKR